MGAIYQPLSALGLSKPAGQVGIQLLGKDSITPFGHATLNFKQSSTKSEIRTPEDPARPIIATDYSDAMASVDIEFGNMNDLGLGLAFAANVSGRARGDDRQREGEEGGGQHRANPVRQLATAQRCSRCPRFCKGKTKYNRLCLSLKTRNLDF